MADVQYHSVAFAGSGSVDAGTATSLLNNWLPKNLGAALRPARIPRKQAALNAIVNWLETDPDPDDPEADDTLGANGTKASDDVIADLIRLREEDGDEVTLVYLLPEATDETPIPEAELAVLKAAFDAGITVKNLAGAGALDDIDPDVIFPPEPEPEVAAETAPQPMSEGDLDAVEPVRPVSYSGDDVLSVLDAHITNIVLQVLRNEGLLGDKPRATDKDVAKTVIDKVAAKLAEAKPPFDPPFVSETDAQASDSERVKYYVTNDANGDPVSYRKAQTRPRKDEEPVMLTLEEIDSLVQRGLIDDSSTADKKPTTRRRAATR